MGSSMSLFSWRRNLCLDSSSFPTRHKIRSSSLRCVAESKTIIHPYIGATHDAFPVPKEDQGQLARYRLCSSVPSHQSTFSTAGFATRRGDQFQTLQLWDIAMIMLHGFLRCTS